MNSRKKGSFVSEIFHEIYFQFHVCFFSISSHLFFVSQCLRLILLYWIADRTLLTGQGGIGFLAARTRDDVVLHRPKVIRYSLRAPDGGTARELTN